MRLLQYIVESNSREINPPDLLRFQITYLTEPRTQGLNEARQTQNQADAENHDGAEAIERDAQES